MTRPLVGWKQISAWAQLHKNTLRRLCRQFGLPIIHGPTGKPMLFPEDYHVWVLKWNDTLEKTAPDVSERVSILDRMPDMP